MKLQQLATKPQLIKIEIDDENVVAEYGEAIEFYIHDRQSMETYMQLAQLDGDVSQLTQLMEKLVLDETGAQILNSENMLPMPVMVAVIQSTVERLGNGTTPTTSR